MVIEGDHGSTYFHPDSLAAKRAVQCQVTLQQQNGGDANIGRKLYPLLEKAGFESIQVSPRQIYVDDSKPNLVEGFTKNTFTAIRIVTYNSYGDENRIELINHQFNVDLDNQLFSFDIPPGTDVLQIDEQ